MRFVIHRKPGGSWSFVLLALLFATSAHSQSLGDLARQEQERKRDLPSHVTHVYDNDDLARPHILVPEDQKRVDAEKKKSAPPAGNPPAEAADSEPKTNVPVPTKVPQDSHAVKAVLPEPELHSRARQPRTDSASVARPTFSRAPLLLPVTPSPSHVVHSETQTQDAANGTRHKEVSSETVVRVQPGDTLWKLAAKHLGSGKNWLLLAAYNPQVSNPARLQVGMSVRLQEETSHSRSPRTAVVKRGDSLWKLAQAAFGDGNAWSCVAQANPRLQKSDLILIGQKLTIPDSCDPPLLAQTHRLAVSFESVPRSTTLLVAHHPRQ